MTETKQQEQEPPKMEYRMLGNSGLKVSVLGFGIMTFESLEKGIELLRAARKGGVNFFDNAEFYGKAPGDAEIVFGKALKKLQEEDSTLWRRSDLVITTKLFWGPNPGMKKTSPTALMGGGLGVNEFGVSRKHLIEGIQGSLKRLQLDYVDVVYAHRYDHMTPILEIVRGFTDLIRRGYATYWGTSCWPSNKIIEAYWIAKHYDLIAPITEQPVYNMFTRSLLENEYLDVFKQPYGIGTTTWSPLDNGILTGKYNNGIPENSRLHSSNKHLGSLLGNEKYRNENKIKICVRLKKICDEKKWSMVSLAIGWCLKNKNVSCVMLGASKKSQIIGNLEGIKVARSLTNEDMKKIEEILNNKPKRNPYIYTQFRTCKSTIQTIN